jgi:hypothetical protein
MYVLDVVTDGLACTASTCGVAKLLGEHLKRKNGWWWLCRLVIAFLARRVRSLSDV